MTTTPKDDEPLSPQDLMFTDIHIDAEKLRKLIEGLRALPNVSDLAVINAISEFDRLASHFEEAQRKRQLILERAIAAAQKIAPQAVEAIRATGGIPSDLSAQILDAVFGSEPHPTCDCRRCKAKREATTAQSDKAANITTH